MQISYIVVFLFVGANLGNIKCGTGSRWTMSLAALVMIGISTAASFGIAAACGLFYGPVHSLLPFILLGIGVDDAFVIGKICLVGLHDAHMMALIHACSRTIPSLF